MTEIVLKPCTTLESPSGLALWLRSARDWLRQASVAARLSQESVEDLSDSQLRDIGAERRDISKAMDRELGRIGLLDAGWQRPRRSHR
ncbi:hypothetical protein EN828_24695 [Mesorhizobium sp. M2D.F.Ca.ET.185.01.1.1]|uniref:hypothetical protein n=1 Tax=unclassified Mesorhizobium TaxID=325217 RepID=UPI000FCB6C3D|nr:MULTISPECIES: hypothetical protein [unclassified Mesorhizobium]TGP48231.1 hypothetical protein EN873_35115 [bacterium M00.F.Ca.ET.230.01.1.1]TGP75735.1 hypothetical protein EN870_23785 [bacterium M00.F.Ca.ET.227.01.1.1]TGP87216.1 hypothetical protein EN864_23550 [bacterium M00.F.Ca.ET.221.01.1.1]TGP91708.1 hypothetical protein EN865_22220 [bacterium M00.F.Ca.ET.222.01.1.1]TGT50701.1 hypothetical protein EN813_050785 [Mesorhizobium sp. M00.F.Ca.ET.170.01.1.1]TGT69987.1 hypothetical protein 